MKTLRKFRFISLMFIASLLVITAIPTMSLAVDPPINLDTGYLGAATNFAVLAYSTITNDGTTIIKGNGAGVGGDIGVSPLTSITGLLPADVSDGTIHSADTSAANAKLALSDLYDAAAGRRPRISTSVELGGRTLTPGTYYSASGFTITGTLTLDGNNETNPVFVFQSDSTLITASASDVVLIRGARWCRTFWQVGSSATLGSGSNFVGHIFALTSIWVGTGATVTGQLLAENGEVTLLGNKITNPVVCDVITPTPTPTVTTALTATPTTASPQTGQNPDGSILLYIMFMIAAAMSVGVIVLRKNIKQH